MCVCLETSLLSTLSSCSDDNAQARVCKLLVASVKCCALSASVLKRVISDPTAYSAPVCLQIIQVRVSIAIELLKEVRCVFAVGMLARQAFVVGTGVVSFCRLLCCFCIVFGSDFIDLSRVL